MGESLQKDRLDFRIEKCKEMRLNPFYDLWLVLPSKLQIPRQQLFH